MMIKNLNGRFYSCLLVSLIPSKSRSALKPLEKPQQRKTLFLNKTIVLEK